MNKVRPLVLTFSIPIFLFLYMVSSANTTIPFFKELFEKTHLEEEKDLEIENDEFRLPYNEHWIIKSPIVSERKYGDQFFQRKSENQLIQRSFIEKYNNHFTNFKEELLTRLTSRNSPPIGSGDIGIEDTPIIALPQNDSPLPGETHPVFD